jgi:predicted transcriptional regulator
MIVTLRLSDEVVRAVDERAKAEGRARANWIQQLVIAEVSKEGFEKRIDKRLPGGVERAAERVVRRGGAKRAKGDGEKGGSVDKAVRADFGKNQVAKPEADNEHCQHGRTPGKCLDCIWESVR